MLTDICCYCCQVSSAMSNSATLRTAALQAPLSLRFSRLEYWSGSPCPYSGDPVARNEPTSFMSPALAGKFFTTRTTWEALNGYIFALCLHPCSKPLALRGSHNPHSPALRLGEWGWIEILVTFQISEANFCGVLCVCVCVYVCVCIHVCSCMYDGLEYNNKIQC